MHPGLRRGAHRPNPATGSAVWLMIVRTRNPRQATGEIELRHDIVQGLLLLAVVFAAVELAYIRKSLIRIERLLEKERRP